MKNDAQSEQPLAWLPHELAMYDEVLEKACAVELKRLACASSQERLRFICDTREVHKRLYAGLAPAEHPECAGTYRGTPETSLERRRSGVHRENSEGFQEFAAPEKVAVLLDNVADQAKRVFDLPSGTAASTVLSETVRLFYVFGLVHPFLDGNGHIQRLIFAVCIMERSELQLTASWTIHPRPYDIEIKLAFEAPTTEARLAALCRVLAAYVTG